MSDPLPRLHANRKLGTEPLHEGGAPLSFKLLDFWQWSASDLVSNATRGRLAEFIVATAFGLGGSGVRDEWDAFDMTTPEGIRIEVKSAGYVQSWFQKKLSSIIFRTPSTRAWDPDTNEFALTARRQADVYVFALLDHKDKHTVDPLDVSQWRFFIVPTSRIGIDAAGPKSLPLKALERLCRGSVSYGELASEVWSVFANNRDRHP